MKNYATILVLVFAITFTASAQGKKEQKERQVRPQFTVEQHTVLAVKKMALALDLTEKQQNQIKPLVMAQATKRKDFMEKMKIRKESNQKPTSDELFAMKNQQLDNQIAMKNNMQQILTKEQFEKFEKMSKNRKTKGKKMMEKRRDVKKQMIKK